jgi:hypothetical protein
MSSNIMYKNVILKLGITHIENKIKDIFKEKFVQMKDYGSEYFYGDSNEMKNIINDLIKKESDEIEYNNSNSDDNDFDCSSDNIINTYNELIEKTNIQKIIITNIYSEEGYILYDDLYSHHFKRVNCEKKISSKYNNDSNENTLLYYLKDITRYEINYNNLINDMGYTEFQDNVFVHNI